MTAVAALTAALAIASVTSAPAGTTSGATVTSAAPASSARTSSVTPAMAKPAAVTYSAWTAYVLVGHTEGFRQVTGDFKVPTVTCTSATSKASFWIGLDGYGNSTVEQVGISTDCHGGVPSYLAWWEMAPNGTNYKFTVYPGDSISMLVKYIGGAWDLALTDLTRDDNAHKFNLSETCPSGNVCENMTAEAALEADGGKNLSKFTTTGFTEVQAVDSSYATTGLVANGSVWGLAKLLMTGSNGQNLANPSTITDNGEVFSLTYKQPN
jgi:hypothetical protein